MAKKPSPPPPRGSVTSLVEYRRKRDFRSTAEPRGGKLGTPRLYIVQKHAASRLHYDFRLELDGALKSWAVPKGPSVDPKAKRLAVHVEDHPIEYGGFEGTIPQGEYGGGTVMLWDRGTWEPLGDPRASYRAGRLKFKLHGERLQGLWTLVRMSGPSSENGKNWLLIKDRDDAAGGPEPVEQESSSVASGRTMDGIGRGEKRADTPVTAARRSKIPSIFAPQLASLASEVPAGDDWLHEIKLDGYRILAVIGPRGPRLISRNGKDWTDRFPTVAAAVAKLPLRSGILDGEVVALRDDGKSDFQLLQNVLKSKNTANIVYFVFDLPFHDGKDLRALPLVERKRALAGIVAKTRRGTVRLSDHFLGDGMKVYEHACRLGLEGIISKRIDAPYESKRAPTWRKIKCSGRQELVITGWTDPQGARSGFGALFMGHHDSEGRLVYSGKVGTGFDQKLLADLARRFARMSIAKSPYDVAPPRAETRGAHWVRPEIVAEIEFTEWTQDGRLRHPAFIGIREDKDAREVVREPLAKPARAATTRATRATPGPAKAARSPAGPSTPARLTHPERVLWPDVKLTKAALAAYYESVADLMLPHIAGRPLAIVRCPDGHTQPCFFQKHVSGKNSEWLQVDDLSGLLGLVQMSALEIHPWGALADRMDRPDRVVFDLDPGPGVPWRRVIEGARAVRASLDELELRSFVRTSGGKGLHVVLPLARRIGWDELKAFAKTIAENLVQREPDRYIATMSKARRPGKIFIDWLRNGEGATAIASYSTRARPGAPVAVPLTWEELDGIRGGDVFKVKGMAKRIAQAGDPWPDFFALRQSIPASAVRSLTRGTRRSRGA